MKSTLHNPLLGSVALAGLLAMSAVSPSQAAVASPIGTWDCLVSGSQGVGLAYLTFAEDFTFSGYELLTTKAPVVISSTSSNPRGDGNDVGRDVTTNSFNLTSLSSTNLFGFLEISGPWTYDLFTGCVVGYFQEVVESEGSTNVHSIGFRAKVTPNRKLWLVASTPIGRVTYNGRPFSGTVPDLSGSWYAYNYRAKQKLVEFFDMTPAEQPYLFNLSGSGAGYTFEGVSMVSTWKKIGFTTWSTTPGDTNLVLRSTAGSFYPRRSVAITKGQEETGHRLNYNAALYAPAGAQ